MKENTNFFERVEAIISYYKISSVNDFALNYLNYKSSEKINRLKKEGTNPSFEILTDISNKFVEINIEWLLTGKGEMLKNKYSFNENINIVSEPEQELTVRKLKTDYFDVDKQQIPLYDIQAAAGFTFLFSNQNQQIPLDYIRIPNAPKCDGALYIRGDSMYPLLKSGDIACYKSIQTLDDIRYGEMYLLDIENTSDRYLAVKYIQKSDLGNDYLRLVSENKHHDPRDEFKGNIKALALIKATIRYNTIS